MILDQDSLAFVRAVGNRRGKSPGWLGVSCSLRVRPLKNIFLRFKFKNWGLKPLYPGQFLALHPLPVVDERSQVDPFLKGIGQSYGIFNGVQN